jgi:hypothetical protein
MASIISAGTTSGTALNMAGDTSGVLQLATNGSTTAVTIDTSQNATFAGKVASAGALTLASNGTTTALTIDTSQKVLVNTTTARANFFNSIISPIVQVEGTNFSTSSYSSTRNSNDANGSGIVIAKSRGTTVGSNTIVQNADIVGTISFQGNDGTEFVEAARINGIINGTPGANDMPGGLTFATTADGADGPTERMRIDSSGNVGIGGTSGGQRLYVTTTSGTSAYFYNSSASALSSAAVLVGKGDNNSTTSNVLVQFLINGGATGSGQINANGANTAAFGSFSDARLKENIEPLPPQLNNILALKPSEFDYKDGSGHQIGFIAQEMQEIYPDVVGEDINNMLTITGWSKTEARLVKAIQEQQTIINDLTARITALEGAA